MRAIQGLRIPNKETISRTNMRGGNHLPKSWSMLCGQGISEKKPQGMHFVTPPLVRAISSFNLPIPRWPYATPSDSPFKGKREPKVPTHAWHFRAKKSFFPSPTTMATGPAPFYWAPSSQCDTVRKKNCAEKNNPSRSQF